MDCASLRKTGWWRSEGRTSWSRRTATAWLANARLVPPHLALRGAVVTKGVVHARSPIATAILHRLWKPKSDRQPKVRPVPCRQTLRRNARRSRCHGRAARLGRQTQTGNSNQQRPYNQATAIVFGGVNVRRLGKTERGSLPLDEVCPGWGGCKHRCWCIILSCVVMPQLVGLCAEVYRWAQFAGASCWPQWLAACCRHCRPQMSRRLRGASIHGAAAPQDRGSRSR